MRKTTQREIRNLIQRGGAVDLTDAKFAEIAKLQRKVNLEIVAISAGIYGKNGAIFRDRKTGELYAIKSRSTALFQMVQ